MEIGDEECEASPEVIGDRDLSHYCGPEAFPSKVRQLAVDVVGLIGTEYAITVNSRTDPLIP